MSSALVGSVSRWQGLLGLVLLTVACGNASTPSASAAVQPDASVTSSPSAERPSRVTVTLTDEGCALDAPSPIDAGPLRVEMINETGGQFDIDLWRLDDGHAYDEFDDHVAEEVRRLGAGEAPLGHPAFASLVAESSADAASDGALDADVTAGTYGIACISFSPSADLAGIWAVGPLEAR